MKTMFIPRLGALGLAVLLSACNLIDFGSSGNGAKLVPCDLFDSDSSGSGGVSGTTSAWIGKHLDSLFDASALAFRDGFLYVGNRHAAAPGVAAVDAGTGLITAYYPQLLPPSALAFTADGHLVAVETDYMEGAVSVIDPSTQRIRQGMIAFGSDNAAASANGKVYLFDRTTGVVTGFAGNCPDRNVTLNVQTGPESNPYGIAIANGRAWIPRYNLGSLLTLDPDQVDGGIRDSIDLSEYSRDSSSNAPRMSLVAAHGGYVFVALQRLNHQWAALDASLVLVIDAATKAIVDTIPLHFRNPVAGSVHDGAWYVAGVAGYGDLLGGVEKIDLTARAHAGVVATEEDIGGDLSAYVATGEDAGYAVYSAGAWPDIEYRVKKVGPPVAAKAAAR